MTKPNLSGITTATWVRIIGLAIILINQVSVSIFDFQLLPFGDAAIYEGVSTVLTIVMSAVAGWKNNSITPEAQEADRVLTAKKGVK